MTSAGGVSPHYFSPPAILMRKRYVVSVIQEKIRQLQRQQAKIDLLNDLANYTLSLRDPQDHDGVAKEIQALMANFLAAAKLRIEAGETLGEIDKSGEVRLPSEVIAMSKNAATDAPPAQPKQSNAADLRERAEFAKQWKHLGGKKVKGISEDTGEEVQGPVLKLDAPFAFIRNDLSGGELVRVRPDTITT